VRVPQRRRFAELLLEAAAVRVPMAPLTDELPTLTAREAYGVQREMLRLRRRDGDRRLGWKVALTSAATRAELQMDEPIAGHLAASSARGEGAAVALDRFIAPGVEPQIAVVMARDLSGPGVTPFEVLRAAEGAVAALGIVDCRYRDWKCTVADAIADNAFAAGLVLGGRLCPLAGLDLRLEGVAVEHNGRLAATAAGAATLDHPLNAVAWLANHLAGLGGGLKVGDVVLTGSLTGILRPQAGDHLRAAFTHLGPVSVRFS
jgi:2-keto-4-pentenoate hydratase